MTRDPLGKRALFSESAKPKPAPRPFDITVECSACHAKSTLSLPQFALQHFPVGVWLPWRKQSNLMRCPACDRIAWHAITRAT